MNSYLKGGSLTACLFASIAFASDNADIVIKIEDRRPVSASKVSSIVHVIYRQDLEESGASTLIEYFQTHTNLQISGASSGIDQSGTIDLRGFGERAAENVLVLLNGRVLNNITLENPDLTAIPIQAIERVEILNGSAGVLYGDGAVGGVVNIITNESTGPSYATFETGSFGSAKTSVRLTDTSTQGHQLALQLNAKTTDGYRDYSSFNQSHAAISYAIPMRFGQVAAGAEQARTDGYLSGVVESTVLDADRQTFRGNSVQDKTSILRSVWAQIQTKLDVQNEVSIDFSRRLSHQEGTGGVFGSPYSIDQLLTTNTLAPSLLRKTEVFGNPTNIVIGGDYVFGDYRTGSSAIRSQENKSIFSRAEIAIDPSASLVLGVRSTNSTDQLLVGTKVEHDVQSFEIGFEQQTRLGAFLIRIDENFRLATVDEQVTYPAPNYTATDTPIAPQTGQSFELGWRGANASASIYALNNRNEIFYDPSSSTNTTAGRTNRYGINASHEYLLPDGTAIENFISLSSAEFDEGTYTGKTVPATSPLSYALKIRRNFSGGYTALWSTRYLASQYSINDWANAFGKHNGYTTSNLNLRKRFEDLNLQLTVKNVFDTSYDNYHLVSGGTMFRSPADSRSFVVSAQYEF